MQHVFRLKHGQLAIKVAHRHSREMLCPTLNPLHFTIRFPSCQYLLLDTSFLRDAVQEIFRLETDCRTLLELSQKLSMLLLRLVR